MAEAESNSLSENAAVHLMDWLERDAVGAILTIGTASLISVVLLVVCCGILLLFHGRLLQPEWDKAWKRLEYFRKSGKKIDGDSASRKEYVAPPNEKEPKTNVVKPEESTHS